MKSGLEGRNNCTDAAIPCLEAISVSMKSGLEGRNNENDPVQAGPVGLGSQ